jgi:hypothetical protein
VPQRVIFVCVFRRFCPLRWVRINGSSLCGWFSCLYGSTAFLAVCVPTEHHALTAMRDALDGNTINRKGGSSSKKVGKGGGDVGVVSLKGALQQHLLSPGPSARPGGGAGFGGWAKAATAVPAPLAAAAPSAADARGGPTSITVSKMVVVLDSESNSELPLYSACSSTDATDQSSTKKRWRSEAAGVGAVHLMCVPPGQWLPCRLIRAVYCLWE